MATVEKLINLRVKNLDLTDQGWLYDALKDPTTKNRPLDPEATMYNVSIQLLNIGPIPKHFYKILKKY